MPTVRRRQLLLAALLLPLLVTPAFPGGPAPGDLDRTNRLPATVTVDDARRIVTVALPEAPDGARARRPRQGKLLVRNKSGYTVDVYLSLNDTTTPWQFVDTLPSRYLLRVTGLTRGTEYQVAGAVNGESTFSWGPRAFRMGRRFRWTLLP
jgi:hypothetical protein